MCLCMTTEAECFSCVDRIILFLNVKFFVFTECLMSDKGVKVEHNQLQLPQHIAVYTTAGCMHS